MKCNLTQAGTCDPDFQDKIMILYFGATKFSIICVNAPEVNFGAEVLTCLLCEISNFLVLRTYTVELHN